MSVMRNEITACIKTKYGALPERLWMRFPDYTVFRHADNQKWFAVGETIAHLEYLMDLGQVVREVRGDGMAVYWPG